MGTKLKKQEGPTYEQLKKVNRNWTIRSKDHVNCQCAWCKVDSNIYVYYSSTILNNCAKNRYLHSFEWHKCPGQGAYNKKKTVFKYFVFWWIKKNSCLTYSTVAKWSGFTVGWRTCWNKLNSSTITLNPTRIYRHRKRTNSASTNHLHCKTNRASEIYHDYEVTNFDLCEPSSSPLR